ncbi:MAG: TonB-dependent receptor [Alistipes sp.]|nr:TonB-dependent receptor [Alistipes sp.]
MTRMMKQNSTHGAFSAFVRKLSLVICFLSISAFAFAQSKVTGTVKDSAGEPIIGASVIVEGTTTGTTTAADGTFTLNVPKNAVLAVSYIGYEGVSQPVAPGQTKVDFVLTAANTELDEVVVIGYGTVKRRDLTGAVASVSGEKLAANPVSDVAQALQGKLPGVNVITQDGRPGAEVAVRVRGGGSITQSNNPLFVVDGFPVSSISDIPASEIESIDVLKDASSTAIYGARGANGVILVTTKGAKAGTVKVTYDGYVQVKKVAKTLETLSAQEYVLHNWSYAASRGSANQDAVEKYFGLGSKYGNHYDDYANVAAHNWTDDVLRTAFTHSHTINVSGGTEKTQAAATLSFVDDQGIKINSDLSRVNASFKIRQQLAKRLHLDFDIRYNERNQNGRESTTSGKGSDVSGAYFYKPIDNPLGGVNYSDVASGFSFGIANIDDFHNPVEMINNIVNKSTSRSFRGSAALSWEIIDGLTARTELSLNRGSSKNRYFDGGYTSGTKSATLSRGESQGMRSLTTINYDFNLGENHKFSVLVGNEIIEQESESSSLSGTGFPDTFDFGTAMGLIHTATQQFSATNSVGVPDHTTSFFGRINYTLFDRFLFTATMRADGSSKFAPDHRWGYFPAGAVAWRLSDEAWLKDVDWLSNLKVRLSYGTSGSDNISSNLWRETWKSLGSGSNRLPINGEFSAFYRPDGLLANNDLKWETTISRNIGVDFGFFNHRLTGALEVYWNTTKDLLMAVPVDNTTGYSYQFQNFGKTSNKGFELSLNAVIVDKKDLKFSVGAIYNYNKNNLDELPNASQYDYSSYWGSSAQVPANDFTFIEGQPIGIVRGYIYEGFYTTSDFNYVDGKYILKEGTADITKAITATYMHPFDIPSGQTAFPGAPKYRDMNGDGLVNLDDATSLGDVMPKHTGSFSLNLNWKNFDLSGNFTWTAGGKVYNVNAMINASGNEYDGIGRQRPDWYADTYKIYTVNSAGDLQFVSTPAELDKLNAGAKYHLPYNQSGIVSSQWLEDGSYLRLQTLTLGYTLPNKVVKKIGIDRIRVYFTANNLFTLTGYSGIDPEVNAYTSGRSGFMSDLRIFPTMNMDFGAYPRARTFTFGANITF